MVYCSCHTLGNDGNAIFNHKFSHSIKLAIPFTSRDFSYCYHLRFSFRTTNIVTLEEKKSKNGATFFSSHTGQRRLLVVLLNFYLVNAPASECNTSLLGYCSTSAASENNMDFLVLRRYCFCTRVACAMQADFFLTSHNLPIFTKHAFAY